MTKRRRPRESRSSAVSSSSECLSRCVSGLQRLSALCVALCLQHTEVLVFTLQECGPLDSEAMVMGVLDQSFDVLVLRYGVQKRIYCKVRLTRSILFTVFCSLYTDRDKQDQRRSLMETISFHFSPSQAWTHSAITKRERSLS